MKNKLVKWFKRNIIRPIRSSYLCIRYPFLYPRNRFTGRHYTNWTLSNYHINNYTKAIKSIFYVVNKESDPKKSLMYAIRDEDGVLFSVRIRWEHLFIYIDNKLVLIRKLNALFEDGYTISDYGFWCDAKKIPHLVFRITGKEREGLNHFENFIVDKVLYWKIKFVDFINHDILSLIHIIPTYNEWDVMEYEMSGWNKRFGKEMLDELKKQLKKDKMLYKWRIMQLKEKWGELRLYCNYGSKELYDIIEKYSELSSHTCIECGKNAEIITHPNSYMLPYCKECYEKLRESSSYIPVVYMRLNEKGKWEEVENEKE